MINLTELLQPSGKGGTWIGAPGPAVSPRLFGGQAVAQGLLAAAGKEEAGRLANSVHAHFLKAGMAQEPVEYRVTSLSEGRSFATRRVDAFQGDLLIFTMVAAFHAPEAGFRHQEEARLPLDLEEAQAGLEAWRTAHSEDLANPLVKRLQNRPIDIVPLDPGAVFGRNSRRSITGSWMRVRDPGKAEPAMQRALLAYASDMLFLRNALLPHGVRPGSAEVQAASLDHAIWFHETPNFFDWHLYITESPWAAHARGHNRGQFYSQDGTLVASVTQESLMRPRGAALERLAS